MSNDSFRHSDRREESDDKMLRLAALLSMTLPDWVLDNVSESTSVIHQVEKGPLLFYMRDMDRVILL